MHPIEILSEIFGFSKFRVGQEEIINHLIGCGDTLAVMPTGAGKSLCYQIPALIFKEQTIVISPIVALMDDQVAALKDLDVPADRMHSSRKRRENIETWKRFSERKLKLLYLSPEALMAERFISALRKMKIAMFVIDEAHCISKWGNNFRTDYAKLKSLSHLFPNSILAAFTATADKTTQLDISRKLLRRNVQTFVQGFDRPNLSLAVSLKINWRAQLLEFLANKREVSGIIYCLSRKQTEITALFLNNNGFKSIAYHAGQDAQLRKTNQNIFMTESKVIMAATIAFGMGVDKPDVRFVVHINLPGSIEALYQEIGRAGRDGKSAETLLIYGFDDLVLRRRFIEEDGSDVEHKTQEHSRLDALLAYCNTPTCRRKVLLAYFDEDSDRCSNCDNCITPTILLDGTSSAKILLLGISETGQSFGMMHLIDVVRGAKTAKIREWHHHRLESFGAGKAERKDFWRGLIQQLIGAGHVHVNIKRYGALEITKCGLEILYGEEEFKYRQFSKNIPKSYSNREKFSKQIQSSLVPESDEKLLEELKAQRMVLAKRSNLPAFVIFRDLTLLEMVQYKPKNREDFLALNGVGPKKLKKYGEIFLAIISSH